MYAPTRRWLGWLLVAVVIGAAGWHLSRQLWARHHRQEAEQGARPLRLRSRVAALAPMLVRLA